MPLNTIFDNLDATIVSREALDKADFTNRTYDFAPDVVESNGLYFLPETEKRFADKTNFNFLKLNDDTTNQNTRLTALDSSGGRLDLIETDITNQNINYILFDNTIVVKHNDVLLVNSTSDLLTRTINLPLTPDDKTVVTIIDYNNTASTDNIIIQSDDNINGLADDYIISTKIRLKLIFLTSNWYVIESSSI